MKYDCWNCKHMRLGHQSSGDFCAKTGRAVSVERQRGVMALLTGGGCGAQGRLFEEGKPIDPWAHLAHR